MNTVNYIPDSEWDPKQHSAPVNYFRGKPVQFTIAILVVIIWFLLFYYYFAIHKDLLPRYISTKIAYVLVELSKNDLILYTVSSIILLGISYFSYNSLYKSKK